MIASLIPGVSVGSVYTNFKTYYEQQNDNIMMLACIFCLGLGYSIACGCVLFKKDKNDWVYFSNNNLAWQGLKLILKEGLEQISLVLLTSIVWSFLLNIGSYIIFKKYFFVSLISFEWLEIVLFSLIITVFYFGSEKFFYLYNVLNIIKNKKVKL